MLILVLEKGHFQVHTISAVMISLQSCVLGNEADNVRNGKITKTKASKPC